MMMIAASNSCFLLENPASSLIFEYKRMREAFRRLMQAGVKAGTDDMSAF